MDTALDIIHLLHDAARTQDLTIEIEYRQAAIDIAVSRDVGSVARHLGIVSVMRGTGAAYRVRLGHYAPIQSLEVAVAELLGGES